MDNTFAAISLDRVASSVDVTKIRVENSLANTLLKTNKKQQTVVKKIYNFFMAL